MWECDNTDCGGELSDKPGWCLYVLERACDGYMNVNKHDTTFFGGRYAGTERCPCKSKKSPK